MHPRLEKLEGGEQSFTASSSSSRTKFDVSSSNKRHQEELKKQKEYGEKPNYNLKEKERILNVVASIRNVKGIENIIYSVKDELSKGIVEGYINARKEFNEHIADDKFIKLSYDKFSSFMSTPGNYIAEIKNGIKDCLCSDNLILSNITGDTIISLHMKNHSEKPEAWEIDTPQNVSVKENTLKEPENEENTFRKKAKEILLGNSKEIKIERRNLCAVAVNAIETRYNTEKKYYDEDPQNNAKSTIKYFKDLYEAFDILADFLSRHGKDDRSDEELKKTLNFISKHKEEKMKSEIRKVNYNNNAVKFFVRLIKDNSDIKAYRESS